MPVFYDKVFKIEMKANSSWKKVVAISPVETPEMEAEGKQHDITKKSHNRNA